MNETATLIKALGGTSEVARAVNAPPSTVSSWKEANRIPPWRMDAVRELARLKGVNLSDAAA